MFADTTRLGKTGQWLFLGIGQCLVPTMIFGSSRSEHAGVGWNCASGILEHLPAFKATPEGG
jgi:hypothetical protein